MLCMKTLHKDREGMHTRMSHVVAAAISIGGGTVNAVKYLRLPSLYSRNAKPSIPSGAGDNRFSVQ
jgi:hypothetical protein